MFGHMYGHVLGHVPGHVLGHVLGNVRGRVFGICLDVCIVMCMVCDGSRRTGSRAPQKKFTSLYTHQGLMSKHTVMSLAHVS